MYKFVSEKPACPVGCRYCFITEHDERRELWNKNPVGGINRACTFINVTPGIDNDPAEQQRFFSFPYELLAGDFIGFTAITDPLWPKLERYLWYWMEKASQTGKLVTCVSKWPISRSMMKKLSEVPNFYLVVTITGNSSIERVPMKKHLETLSLAKEYGVKALPISHPYISGLSDLWFLPEIKNMGYQYFNVKGLRYCDARMGSWMPKASKRYYLGNEDKEILPEDGWRKLVEDAGLELLSPRKWYLKESMSRNLMPKLPRKEAEKLVQQVLARMNTVSSNQSRVVESAVQRRL